MGEAWWARRHPQWATTPTGWRTRPHLHLPASAVPRYLVDRAAIQVRGRLRGRQPWITATAKDLLDTLLMDTDRGLEFGPGDTTLFFAQRVAHVYAIEGFDEWHAPLVERLAREQVTNVTLHLASANTLGYQSDEHRRAYVEAHPDLAPESLDFVFVDGEYRDECALRGLGLLRPGGLMILDNAETYLPGPARSPWRVTEPVNAQWETFARATEGWRCMWTTNGVWDTAIWFKP